MSIPHFMSIPYFPSITPNHRSMSHTIPNHAYVLIIGTMKAGTTSLFRYLQDHPEICPASIKEAEFFSRHQEHKAALNHYSDLWDFKPEVHKYALEASTGYSKYPMEMSVPQAIFEYGLQPKFIYVVRNPFDRIESHLNFISPWDETKRKVIYRHAIRVSQYMTQLERYFAYFSRDQFLILDFDQLCHDPASLLKQIYDFLEISDHYFPETYTIENITPTKKRRLSVMERAMISDTLKLDMYRFQKHYGFDIQKWGF
ncbi:MAG: hypothetical protein EA001_12995 [Oscillatoriales cyanobacterium]|nr:MAG: hypothetical protein EA001_12995 [Oscillatoriales cyanobacterium]